MKNIKETILKIVSGGFINITRNYNAAYMTFKLFNDFIKWLQIFIICGQVILIHRNLFQGIISGIGLKVFFKSYIL